MPELPDFVPYLESLRPRIHGQPLERIRLANPFLLRTVDPPIEPRPEGMLDVQFVDTLGHDGISYTADTEEAERRVRDGEAAVAYLMRPTRIEDVFAYARRGDTLK